MSHGRGLASAAKSRNSSLTEKRGPIFQNRLPSFIQIYRLLDAMSAVTSRKFPYNLSGRYLVRSTLQLLAALLSTHPFCVRRRRRLLGASDALSLVFLSKAWSYSNRCRQKRLRKILPIGIDDEPRLRFLYLDADDSTMCVSPEHLFHTNAPVC